MIQESQLLDISNRLKPVSGRKAPIKLHAKTKVYLSTSSQDKEVVGTIMDLLVSMEAGSYVDWLDNKTDNFNNNRIGFAKRLAKMIKRQNKYILVLTRQTLNSQWSKWELGIAHTLKFKKDELAIFPVVREEDIYLQWEFHNIYPHIVFTNKAGIELDDIKSILNCFQIIYPPRKGTRPMRMSLQKWLLK